MNLINSKRLFMPKFLTAVYAVWLIISCSSAIAANSCKTAFLYANPKHDSAIEMEIPLNEKTVEILDFEYVPLKASLTAAEKVKIIREFIIDQNLKFRTSRRIPGLVIKEKYQKQFQIQNYVEMAGPDTAKKGHLIEIHMRALKNPGDLALQAQRFEKAIGLDPSSIHIHMVFDFSRNWLSEKNTYSSFALVEFWRRLNLVMEMQDMFENGVSVIYNKSGPQSVNNAPIAYSQISHAYAYLVYLLDQNPTKPTPKLGPNAKMGWVGFWGLDKYDKENLFGFEFRSLDAGKLPKNLTDFLNAMPAQVESRKNFLSEEDISNWLEHKNIKPDSSHMGYLVQHFNPHLEFDALMARLPYSFKKYIYGMGEAKARDAINERGRLRYILHDWSTDPILYNKPEMHSKIKNAQLKALRRWQKGENEKIVVQEFLLDSGLYEHFANSVDFQI